VYGLKLLTWVLLLLQHQPYLQWSIGVGSTAVSLATADGAGSKARAVVPLGVQSLPVGAAIGASANRIDINLDAPLVAEPGTFVHVILKMPVATATSLANC